jgi:hypothetical protein
MKRTNALDIFGKVGSKAKHYWHEKAPAIHAFTTSMWLDERALLTCTNSRGSRPGICGFESYSSGHG